jgi:hypothetical protein
VCVLKKSMRFLRSAQIRFSFILFGSLFLLPALLAPALAVAQDQSSPSNEPGPQPPWKYDGALSAFYQVTGASNGNFIREDTTESIGGLGSFRRPYRPWFGYELSYGFTRYSESYNKGVARVQDNVHEFTAAYLLQAPLFHGVAPFVTIGTGMVIFAPTSTGGGGRSSQVLPVFVYSLGLNRPLLSDRLGIRLQYRSLRYKTPSFNNVLLDAHTLRTTMEPSIGIYYRF